MKAHSTKKSLRLLAAASLLTLSGFAHSAPVIDVLVLYIDAAQNTRSGRDMDARIGSYIAYSNQAFANSDVDMRFRLVGSEKVNLNYTYVTEANLGALRTNSEVARLRQKYGADLVTLINLRQPMSEGYICGVGYVPPGDASSGRLYNNASSAAFSLVGVDCGLSTFAHELGHNMSLGHSYSQRSEGGVWSWGRGHGVQGLFSTIMAYPQSYGTRNQVQQFSNPNQRKCVDQACGVVQGQRDGADAAANLNNLGAQLAAFMPSITVSDPVDNQPTLPACSKNEVANNLIVNGEFNSVEGWNTLFNLSTLTQVDAQTNNCIDKVLSVSSRTQVYSDAYHHLGNKVQIGKDYAFSAKLGIANAARDTVRVALRIEESGSVRYQYLKSISATSNGLTAYNDTFRLDATVQPTNVGILFYGPVANTNILADEVALVEVANEVPATSAPAPESQTIFHDRFEQSATGWSSLGSSRTAFSIRAAEGQYGIRNYYRAYDYSGPIREVTGLFEPHTTYSVSASVYVRDTSAASSTARIWIYYVDDQGGHWAEAADASISTNAWQTVNGNFNISPVGPITQMRMLVGGPRAMVDLYVDDLRAVRE